MDILSLQWTIPGVIFLYSYTVYYRPQKMTSLSGWEYIMMLVLISTIHSEFIVPILRYPFLLSEKLQCLLKGIHPKLIFFIKNIMFPFVLGARWAKAVSYIKRKEPHHDPFINFCQNYEGDVIFLTLKSKKIYTGILIQYPEITSTDSQHIMVLPIMSGFRNDFGEAIWTTKYPDIENNKSNFIELIIPKEEITTATPWNKSAKFSHPSS